MSVFNAETPATVTDLVGEGKKYATVDDLAKAYLNANSFIDQLKGETGELRQELERRLTAEDLVKQFQQQKPAEPNPVVVAPPAPNTPAEAPQVDLDARIKELLDKERQQSAVVKNVEEVTNTLISVFGDEDKANQAVKAKAAELGVTVQFLQEVAAKSPKAFYSTLGLQEAPKPTPGVSRAEVNPAVVAHASGAKEGTYSYYENIRKTDPKRYFSPTIQNQMFKDRTRLGDSFYS